MATDNVPSFNQVTVTINDQPWKEVSSFENCGSDDHVYIVAIDPVTEAATLRFGDGQQGRRPPTGSRIEATYRTGNGSAGIVLSFSWMVTDPNLHKASLVTITTLPNSFRLSFYQGIENSWQWRFINWLCDALKQRLLGSLASKKQISTII
jgi:hypothetical protein